MQRFAPCIKASPERSGRDGAFLNFLPTGRDEREGEAADPFFRAAHLVVLATEEERNNRGGILNGRVEEILEFWFGAADRSDRQQVWFAPEPAVDRACSAGFRADHERAEVRRLG